MRKIPKRYVRPIPLPRQESKPPGDAGNYRRPITRGRLNVRSEYEAAPWPNLGGTLVLAGMAYPCLVALVVIAVSGLGLMLQMGSGDFSDLSSVPLGLLILCVGTFVSCCVMLCYIGAVTLLALAAVAGVIMLLGLSPRWRNLAAFCGGLVGFLCFLPLMYGLSSTPDRLLLFVVTLAIGPGLGICWGILAGAYAGVVNQGRQRAGDQAGDLQPLRFSIRQMMLLTLVVSLLLSLLRAAQMLNAGLLFSLIFWLICQTLFQKPAIWIAQQWRLRRSRRLLSERHKHRIVSRNAAQEAERHTLPSLPVSRETTH